MLRLAQHDLDVLLGKSRSFTLGEQIIAIAPLGIADFARAAGMISAIMGGVQEVGKAGWATALPILLAAVPGDLLPLLELLSGIHREDLARLPPFVAADLLLTCIEVNLESMGDLEKKSQALGERINRLAGTTALESPVSSSS